jgi:hypothetical protein
MSSTNLHRFARRWRLAALVAAAATVPAAAQEFSTVTTFSAGVEGWEGPLGPGGATTLETTGGNPDHNLRTDFSDFGITFDNSTNAGFVRDLTSHDAVAIEIDLRVELIEFFGTPVSRPWLVDLRDTTNPEPGYPWTSVWFKFDDVASATHSGWTRLTVFVKDPGAPELPEGWGGYGAEDKLGNPILPEDRTFASVLAGYDEIAFTTFEPGFFFGETVHIVRIDNVALRSAIFGDGFERDEFGAWDAVEQ